jgi:hypothetical protein
METRSYNVGGSNGTDSSDRGNRCVCMIGLWDYYCTKKFYRRLKLERVYALFDASLRSQHQYHSK